MQDQGYSSRMFEDGEQGLEGKDLQQSKWGICLICIIVYNGSMLFSHVSDAG